MKSVQPSSQRLNQRAISLSVSHRVSRLGTGDVRLLQILIQYVCVQKIQTVKEYTPRGLLAVTHWPLQETSSIILTSTAPLLLSPPLLTHVQHSAQSLSWVCKWPPPPLQCYKTHVCVRMCVSQRICVLCILPTRSQLWVLFQYSMGVTSSFNSDDGRWWYSL